jgi:MarR family transcriptional regulator, organic hydroperoxide resistance regulator
MFKSRFSGPEESPGFLLWQVSNLWQRQINQALQAFDLTHVQFVLLANLVWLHEQGEQVSQVRLSEQTHTHPMVVSQVLRTLMSKGLLSKERHPQDVRAWQLLPTAQGIELVVKTIPVVEAADQQFFQFSQVQEEAWKNSLQALLSQNQTT